MKSDSIASYKFTGAMLFGLNWFINLNGTIFKLLGYNNLDGPKENHCQHHFNAI